MPFWEFPAGLSPSVMNHSVHFLAGHVWDTTSGPGGRWKQKYMEASHFLYDLPQTVGHDKMREESMATVDPYPAIILGWGTDSESHPLMNCLSSDISEVRSQFLQFVWFKSCSSQDTMGRYMTSVVPFQARGIISTRQEA